MNKNKGFTLIELLVVIAIIGILSSVVLASLSSARDKGKDAAVKSQLSSMKAQAELFYSKGETYDGVCNGDLASSGFGGHDGPGLLNSAWASSGSATSLDAADAVGQVTDGLTARCIDSVDGWIVTVPLSASGTVPSLYCSDNTGLSKETAKNLVTGQVACL